MDFKPGCQGTSEIPSLLCTMTSCDHNNSTAIFQALQCVHFCLTQNGFFAPMQVTVEQCFTRREGKEGSKWPHCRKITNQAYQKKKNELNKWMAACAPFRGLKGNGWDLTACGWKMKTRQDLRWVGVLAMGSPTLSVLYVSQVRYYFLIIFRG